MLVKLAVIVVLSTSIVGLAGHGAPPPRPAGSASSDSAGTVPVHKNPGALCPASPHASPLFGDHLTVIGERKRLDRAAVEGCPRPTIDYKIRKVYPDPTIDYKILAAVPESPDSYKIRVWPDDGCHRGAGVPPGASAPAPCPRRP